MDRQVYGQMDLQNDRRTTEDTNKGTKPFIQMHDHIWCIDENSELADQLYVYGQASIDVVHRLIPAWASFYEDNVTISS